MPKIAMIRNGPRIRLKIAPGRRMTSMSSLRRTAERRARTLSSAIASPRGGSAHGLDAARPDERRQLLGCDIRGCLAVDELGEHFVERGPVLAREHDVRACG